MWLLLVPVCLAIFSSPITSASEPHYVITVPADLQQGAEEKACVTFLDLKGEVDIKIELKKDDHVHPIAEQKINTHDHSGCYSFQVPLIKEDKSVWQLHVSAHGENVNVDESKNVVIIQTNDVCVVQTDKSTYKPGDTVKFRLMTVNHQFLPINKKYPLVEIKDPNKNRIGQWLDVSTEQGFADFSFHLANEINLGSYKINIPNGCEKYFTVDTYVLKRWELKINAPSDVFLADKSIHLEVCGSYTYGKPVEGKIDLSVCLEKLPFFDYYHNVEEQEEEEPTHNCTIIKGEKTDSKGCISRDIKFDFFESSSEHTHPISYLDIDTELTEVSTGHSEKASLELFLNPEKKTITFLERQSIYHKGFPYHGKVKVFESKKPLANEAITISTLNMENHSEAISVHAVTDSNGIAQFTFNTSEWEEMVGLRARLSSQRSDVDNEHMSYFHFQNIPQDWLWLSPYYSSSESLLFIHKHSDEVSCHSEQSVMVDYDIHDKILDSHTDHLHFFYMLLTKSGIFSYKEHNVHIKHQENSPNVHGSFALNFHVDDDFFPAFSLLVFSVLPNGETIAHTTTFNVSPCVQSKVKLSFSEEQVRPGEDVSLDVTADAGSWCSVRSVDKGYLLEKAHQDSSLFTDVIEILRSSIHSNEHSHLTADPDVRQCPENTTQKYEPTTDVFSLFQENTLKIFTNTQIRVPLKCVTRDFTQRSSTQKKPEKKDHEKQIQKRFPRRNFPDTWLYELVSVGSDGHTVLNRTTPDSITTWETDAICLGKTGFASVKDVELITFQPYFIDLIVPYSVVQGEKFTIQAVVFSYAKKCILIVISLSDSEDLITVKDKEQARCVCEGHSHSFTWDASAMKPKTLKIHVDSGSLEVEGDCHQEGLLIGQDRRKDSVEKTIVVKPKGYEDIKTQTFLLLPSDKQEGITIKINAPESVVPDSERSHLIIQGDILASVVIFMDDILGLPEGCGEQNAAKMSRFVHTMKYLESIDELKPEQKARSIESLVKSYQKQLTHKTENGSYSMFPDERENIWLTAYVIKTFSGAQKYIYVDETNIQQAVKWLHTKQLPTGCFKVTNDYFNNYIDVEEEIMLTAYVTIALLEHRVVYNGSIVEDALSCLRKSIENATSEHNMAILAYAFTLSGDSALRDQLLKKLDEKATKEGDLTHWGSSSFYRSTETASYVILALLSEKIITIKTLEDCVNVIRWILTQQSAWGGFGSSQDTATALQALAKYSKAINHKKGDATVTITSKSGFQKIFHVDKNNSLLVQNVDLPEIPGEYTASITGDGLVYLQSHLHYHTLPDQTGKGPFSFNVSTEPSTCNQASQKQFDVHMDLRYTGNREKTNMALIILEHVSGYVADKDSIKKLEKNPIVERTEISAKNITIYLSQITHEPISLSFSMEQEAHVENLQPAFAAVLDYYDPDEHTVVEYSSPCSSVVASCAVTAAEREDCGQPNISKDQCEQKGCCFDSSIPGTKWCFFQGFKKTEEH